jgi:hypothetical protein
MRALRRYEPQRARRSQTPTLAFGIGLTVCFSQVWGNRDAALDCEIAARLAVGRRDGARRAGTYLWCCAPCLLREKDCALPFSPGAAGAGARLLSSGLLPVGHHGALGAIDQHSQVGH